MTSLEPDPGEGIAAPLRMLVLGDSTSFTDATGPQLPDHPDLYPNLLAGHLEAALQRDITVTVAARPGQTVRDAARAVVKDRHLQFDLVARADILVVAVGSFDHAPAGVPPSIEAAAAFLRPTRLRQKVRRGLQQLYPHLVRLHGGRRTRTPASEFDRLYVLLLDQLRWLTQGRAAGVVIGPTSHRSAYYGNRHPRHRSCEQRQLRLALDHGFAGVSSWDAVSGHLDALNKDGIHWPAQAHREVASAAAHALLPQLRGTAARIGRPGQPAPDVVSR